MKIHPQMFNGGKTFPTYNINFHPIFFIRSRRHHLACWSLPRRLPLYPGKSPGLVNHRTLLRPNPNDVLFARLRTVELSRRRTAPTGRKWAFRPLTIQSIEKFTHFRSKLRHIEIDLPPTRPPAHGPEVSDDNLFPNINLGSTCRGTYSFTSFRPKASR